MLSVIDSELISQVCDNTQLISSPKHAKVLLTGPLLGAHLKCPEYLAVTATHSNPRPGLEN